MSVAAVEPMEPEEFWPPDPSKPCIHRASAIRTLDREIYPEASTTCRFPRKGSHPLDAWVDECGCTCVSVFCSECGMPLCMCHDPTFFSSVRGVTAFRADLTTRF